LRVETNFTANPQLKAPAFRVEAGAEGWAGSTQALNAEVIGLSQELQDLLRLLVRQGKD
jgi:hypothetical protein